MTIHRIFGKPDITNVKKLTVEDKKVYYTRCDEDWNLKQYIKLNEFDFVE